MRYTKNNPTYDAIRWTGGNLEDCQAFFETWFPQPPPPWPGQTQEPGIVHDPEANTLTIYPGHRIEADDWLVSGGYWLPNVGYAGYPEVVAGAVFAVKYTEIP